MEHVITAPHFRDFSVSDRPACLAIFDENCPEYFAPNERDAYAQHLDSRADNYQVCILDDRVVGAYGLSSTMVESSALRWILFSTSVQGHGLGSAVMSRVLSELRAKGMSVLQISASHKSAPFFARFGAVEVTTIPDGWGPGMHRVDTQIEL